MKSPFPGMDPYLERHWEDVHHALCTYTRDALQEQLGSDLVARLGERLVVETIFDKPRAIFPDVRVVEHGLTNVTDLAHRQGSGIAVAEPVVLSIESEPVRQSFIEIQEPGSGKLITVIEFLSPSNKFSGDGRRKYTRKQRELYEARISLTEIDLTRAGRRNFLAPAAQIPAKAVATYQACVFRGYRWGKFELYALPLRQKLPAIRVPLRQEDSDIVLDIQAVVDQVYEKGRYALTDYTIECIPPLKGEDVQWADQLLREAGKRS